MIVPRKLNTEILLQNENGRMRAVKLFRYLIHTLQRQRVCSVGM
jgi:hypothetical protein